jgi:hypothetical protein
MSNFEISTQKPASFASAALLTTFVIATLISSSLLFLIQPLMAKLMLPLFGGSSSVWAVSMSFFQTMLLLGYGYAHLLRRYVPLREGIVLHVGLMLLGLYLLRFDANALVTTNGEALGTLALLSVLAKTVGFPFAVMSANAPMTQSWFSKSTHKDSTDPYFLYAASNLGSMFALIAYPLAIEPLIGLANQTQLWTIGFGLLATALAVCGLVLITNQNQIAISSAQTVDDQPIAGSRRLWWLLYAFVPSALLSAWTNHITTDVASAPFLWLPPLALYLGSYVLMFRAQPMISKRVLHILLLVSLPIAYAVIYGLGRNFLAIALLAGAVTFMSATCILHRRMYEDRPGAEKLTEFYFIMSLGGVLGGAFVSLIAPAIFSSVTEYPLLLLAIVLLAVGQFKKDEVAALLAKPKNLLVVFCGAWLFRAIVGHVFFANSGAWLSSGLFAIAVLAFYTFFKTNQRFPAYAAIVVLMCELVMVQHSSLATFRNFYGVLTVNQKNDMMVMKHGTTIHGAAFLVDLDPNLKTRPRPLTYFSALGGLAQAITVKQAELAARGQKGTYGVVGLGAGSLACYSNQGETWKYFEINAHVTRVAQDPQYFPFMSRCAPDANVVMGDARLTMRNETNGSYDVLVIDAFSSDSIPVHLMTVEAMQIYLNLLNKDGVLALHVSNVHLDLTSVVAANIAKINKTGAGLVALQYVHTKVSDTPGAAPSLVILIGKSRAALASHLSTAFVGTMPKTDVSPWTDDYSNIVSAIWRMQRRVVTALTSHHQSE